MVEGSFNLLSAAEVQVAIPDFPDGAEFENLGTTIEVIAQPGGTLDFNNKTFELQQFHFHLPSEHLDNGISRASQSLRQTP